MKGIVFTEFLEMAEEKYGPDVVERVIEQADLPNQGAYTAVGTYHHCEMLKLVGELGQETGCSTPLLVRTFGQHLFFRLAKLYPHFFAGITSTVEFLPLVEKCIHKEVRKLYPDAELPNFDCSSREDGSFEMLYRSARPFGDLAEGMILGCIEYFRESYRLGREDLKAESGYAVRFLLIPR